MTDTVSKTVLLLDDNLMSAPRLQSQLELSGYLVQTATSIPQRTDPQLVIINLGSRRLNGVAQIGVCRERFPTARVVGFCGHLEVEIRRMAKDAGIDKILTNDQAFSQLITSL
ncbi:MAG TPA: response regulator [Abditibacteriaceae bacterium]|jgi:DNA-binding response OmpR family regulator